LAFGFAFAFGLALACGLAAVRRRATLALACFDRGRARFEDARFTRLDLPAALRRAMVKVLSQP
jgi:hypothetical protein